MDFKTLLSLNRPILFDGAMGTLLARRTNRLDGHCVQANLDAPEEILSVHRAYLQAGCQAIKTNTFQVSSLLAHGNTSHLQQLVSLGCQLAIQAAEPYDALVFADIGPAVYTTPQTKAVRYIQQADWFLAQGLTHFLIETLPSDEGIEELSLHLKRCCPEAFLLVSFAVDYNGLTREGHQGKQLLTRTAALPEVDAVGLNCVSGPHHLLEYIRTLDLGSTPLSVMPNAGYPTLAGHRTVFQGQPDYFGRKIAQIAQAGAAIVGGCCGTTPEHIAAAAKALSSQPAEPSLSVTPASAPPDRAPERNPLWEKLDSGKRLVAVELDPPANDDITAFMKGVRTLRDAGADAVTIADCPIGRPRADSSLLACKIKRELDLDPLPHMTCRDRNLNATKALLLGLSIENVHNVLVITGDPIPTEARSAVKSVFNFHSRKLASFISGLAETSLSTPFRIFAALNVNSRNFSAQLDIACEKEACGVSGFLTQPILSPEALENLKSARAALKGKILGGIYPVVSHRNACFLNNEISGIRVSEEIISRYEGLNREQAEALAIELSVQTAREILPYTDGLYLMTPFQRVSLICKILEQLS